MLYLSNSAGTSPFPPAGEISHHDSYHLWGSSVLQYGRSWYCHDTVMAPCDLPCWAELTPILQIPCLGETASSSHSKAWKHQTETNYENTRLPGQAQLSPAELGPRWDHPPPQGCSHSCAPAVPWGKDSPWPRLSLTTTLLGSCSENL